MSLVFNDKTFQQADEGTVNVLKYTFGNGINLVSVKQESLPDYYPASCVDPHLLLCAIIDVSKFCAAGVDVRLGLDPKLALMKN